MAPLARPMGKGHLRCAAPEISTASLRAAKNTPPRRNPLRPSPSLHTAAPTGLANIADLPPAWSRMIVTHCQNIHGERRIYLGGKGSIECYIAPADDGRTWTFHLDTAVTGQHLEPDQQRAWAIHTLGQLADALNVAPADLAAVPFDYIAALHAADPYASRRLPSSRRKAPDNFFMAAAPDLGTRPTADFTHRDFAHHQRHRR
jgi:hypothetical protein